MRNNVIHHNVLQIGCEFRIRTEDFWHMKPAIDATYLPRDSHSSTTFAVPQGETALLDQFAKSPKRVQTVDFIVEGLPVLAFSAVPVCRDSNVQVGHFV